MTLRQLLDNIMDAVRDGAEIDIPVTILNTASGIEYEASSAWLETGEPAEGGFNEDGEIEAWFRITI